MSSKELQEKGFGKRTERYIAPNGKDISRRLYEDRVFQAGGWKSWGEYQRYAKRTHFKGLRNTREYRRFSRKAEEEGLSTSTSSKFTRLFLQSADDQFTKKTGKKFEEFLVFIGYRQPDWDFNVGDTPMGSKG